MTMKVNAGHFRYHSVKVGDFATYEQLTTRFLWIIFGKFGRFLSGSCIEKSGHTRRYVHEVIQKNRRFAFL